MYCYLEKKFNYEKDNSETMHDKTNIIQTQVWQSKLCIELSLIYSAKRTISGILNKKKVCPILIYVHFKIAWMYKHELVLSEISSYHVNFLKITCRLISYMLNILCQHHYFFLLAQKQTCFNYVSYFIHFSHVFEKIKKITATLSDTCTNSAYCILFDI